MSKWFMAIALFIYFMFALVQTEKAFAQSYYNLKLQIKDSLTQQPLYGATVTLHKHNHLHISNEEGYVFIDSVPAGKVLLHISYVGYHHHDMQIEMPQNKVLLAFLCPESYHFHETIISAKGNDFAFSGRKKDVLDNNLIARKQGQNISELLKQINGASSLNSSGGIAKPVLRGLSGMRLVTLQGNSKLEGQQWGEDHGLELDPFQANGIQVIKGAAAVEYGPEAIGGVIQVLPKPYKETIGVGGKLQLNSLSNNKQGAGSFSLEGRKGTDKFIAWQAFGSGRMAGDAHAPSYVLSNTGFRENAQSLQAIVGNNKFSWENRFSRFASIQGIFAGSHVGNLADLYIAIGANEPLIIKPFTYEIGKPYQDVTHVLFASEIKWQPNANRKFRFLYTQQVNRRKEFDAEMVYNQALRGVAAMDMEIQSFGVEQHFEQKLKHHWGLKIGASQSWQNNTVAGLNFIIPAFKSFSAGLFTLIKREWLESNLTLGIRYDLRNLEVPLYRRQNKSFAYQRQFGGINAGITYTYLFPKKWLLTASVQTGWRPPAVNELYSYGLHYGIATFEIGDSLLHAERSVQTEINLSKQFKNWQVTASVFAQFFNGFIFKNPLAEPILTIRGAFPAFAFAQEDALLSGAEFSLSFAPQNGWQWQSRFSYLYAQNLGLNQPLYGMPANRMDHTLGYVFGDVFFMKESYVEVQNVWVDRQRRYVENLDYANPPKGYALFHVNMGTNIAVIKNKEPWTVHLSAQNIFNTSYRDYQSRFRYFIDDPGFNFIIRLQIPF
jgi:iron complex outermembrane receptor protein